MNDKTNERRLCEGNDKNDNETCVICSYTGCNNQPKERQPKLACVNCNDSEECAFGFNSSMAVPCKNDVALGDEESCFTRSFNGNLTCVFSHFKNKLKLISFVPMMTRH